MADFLGFEIIMQPPPVIEFADDAEHVVTGALSQHTMYGLARQLMLKFRLRPEPRWGPENQVGQLMAFCERNKYDPFTWVGTAPQPPGHDTEVGNKILTDASTGDSKVQVSDAIGLKVGRWIQIPVTGDRVYRIESITPKRQDMGVRGATDIGLSPALRNNVVLGATFRSKYVPLMQFAGDSGVFRKTYDRYGLLTKFWQMIEA